jgi:hypothetical protein
MNDETTNQQVFLQLEERLAALEPKDVFKMHRDRRVLGVMFLGVAMTVPSILGFKAAWLSWLTLSGMALELCALGVLTFRQVRDVIPDFIDAKRKYAMELDSHFVQYEQIRRQLQALAPQERARRLTYVESRLESLMQRYPLIFGAADKLGVLPALIGLFLQLRAIDSLSMATGVVGIAVLVLYGMALWLARYRLQLRGYARLLKAAEND